MQNEANYLYLTMKILSRVVYCFKAFQFVNSV